MTLLFIYPIFFVLILLKSRKRQLVNTFNIILCFFLLGAASACYIRFLPNSDFISIPLSLTAIIYHCIMLYLLLVPFKRFDAFSHKYFYKTNSLIEIGLVYSIIPISLYYICISISHLNLNMIMIDVNSLRGALIETSVESGTLNTYLKAFCTTFHGMALSIAFYYMIYKPEKQLLIMLLILCSMAQVIHSLNFAAREYVIKYIFVTFMLLTLLKNKISIVWLLGIKRFLFILSGLAILFLSIVTIVRFTMSDRYNNPLDSVFSYLGQGFVYFSQRFTDFPNGIFGGAQSFPIFTGGEKADVYNINSIVSSDYFLNSFSTTIGSWIMDCGIFYTTIACLIHSLIFRCIGKFNLNIFTLYYLIYAYEFIFSCLFFYNDTIGKLRLETFLFVILLHFIDSKVMSKRLL